MPSVSPTISLPPAVVDGVVDVDAIATIDESTPVGLGECAALLGVERQTVDLWRHRGRFPAAEVSTVGGRPWWRWGAVREWAVTEGRLFSEPDGLAADPVTIPERTS